MNYWVTKTYLYGHYLKETTGDKLAKSTFFQHICTYFGAYREDKSFPQVRFSKYSTHSVCDICLALNNFRKTCRTEKDLAIALEAKRLHQQNFSGARRKMEEIKQLAIRYPRDHLVLQLDGMDNTKSYCPRDLIKGKHDVNKPTLPTKIQGCIIYSGYYDTNRRIIFYLNNNHFEQGGSMVVTILHKLLLHFVEDNGHLPRHLHVFADNCWRENKVFRHRMQIPGYS